MTTPMTKLIPAALAAFALCLGARAADFTTSDYEQSGLVGHWDGIDNAGTGVHDPSTRVWRDLTGLTGDGQLGVGAVWSDGICWKNGVDGKPVTVGGNFAATLNTCTSTVEVVLRPSRGNVREAFLSSYSTGTWSLEHNSNSYSDGSARVYFGGSPDVRCEYARIAAGEFTVLSVAVSPSGFAVYKNGVLAKTYSGSLTRPTANVDYVFGGENTRGEMAFRGNYYAVRLYNRPLTAEEIAANHAVDIARFTRTITWRNDDGTVLATENVPCGTWPVYNGEGPAKPATPTACYLFTGWAEDVAPVTSNATYTATYKLVSGRRIVDISTLSDEYIAQDGDIFIGTQNGQVPIRLNQSGMTVTLAGMYLADSIYAYTNDVTILIADDTTNTIKPHYGLPGIRPSTNPAHVLTIKSESANTGVLDVQGGADCAAIGPSRNEICGGVVIEGGTIIATGSNGYPGIGASENGTCGDIAIHGTIAKVVATGSTPIDNGEGSITIAQTLLRTYSNNNKTLTLEPSELLYDITWVDDNGADTTVVAPGVVPIHSPMTKAAAVPYRWVFTGWTPELEAAVSNATYTATFKIVADLSLCTNDWTAADGDEIVGETAHEVSIPGGAHVTINGVAVAGTGGGASAPAPAFAAGGASEIVKFAQAEGGKWTITAFAEMSNESRGTDVTDGQIKVFSADTLEALESATTPAAGATVTETKSAVKATVEVPAPSGKTSQFFKVKFGE